MKNKEYYKDQIIELLCESLDVAVDINTGKPCACEGFRCANCAFNGYEPCANAFMDWLNQEHKERVLTQEEKQYLEAILRPFKDRVTSITKTTFFNCYADLFIDVTSIAESVSDDFSLPIFGKNDAYLGMEFDREYTLEELGLFENEGEDSEK